MRGGLPRKADQEGRFDVETISVGSDCGAGVAPLHEISINEAQTILMRTMTNRNMARNLTEP